MRLLLLIACLIFSSAGLGASPAVWQPSAGHDQVPLWPGKVPDAQALPGPESANTTEGEKLIAGRHYLYLRNISQPTLTVYAPQGKNTGAAVLVIPGGGFEILAMDLEGTE